jgi:glutathione S-transferase
MLDSAYGWLNGVMDGRTWAAGAQFTMADCAAAPALFYSDWVHGIHQDFANVRGYRQRLLDHPAVARSVDEARPYRHFFPPGAPSRD